MSISEVRIISHDSEIYNTLICQICRNLISRPSECSSCRKCFCDDCISKWMKYSTTCPNCRTEYKGDVPSDKFWNQLHSIKVRCQNESYGCHKAFDLANLSLHQMCCPYRPIKCTNLSCSEMVPFKELRAHLVQCTHEACRRCSKCELIVPNSSWESHDCISELKTLSKRHLQESQTLKIQNQNQEERYKAQYAQIQSAFQGLSGKVSVLHKMNDLLQQTTKLDQNLIAITSQKEVLLQQTISELQAENSKIKINFANQKGKLSRLKRKYRSKEKYTSSTYSSHWKIISCSKAKCDSARCSNKAILSCSECNLHLCQTCYQQVEENLCNFNCKRKSKIHLKMLEEINCF